LAAEGGVADEGNWRGFKAVLEKFERIKGEGGARAQNEKHG